jgi:hypothetical protein
MNFKIKINFKLENPFIYSDQWFLMWKDMRTKMVVRTPECNTVEVLHSRWGGLDIYLNGYIVRDDTIPWLWKMTYEYSIPLGENREYALVIVIHRPIFKFGHYTYEFYLNGELVKVKHHSFFFTRSEN